MGMKQILLIGIIGLAIAGSGGFTNRKQEQSDKVDVVPACSCDAAELQRLRDELQRTQNDLEMLRQQVASIGQSAPEESPLKAEIEEYRQSGGRMWYVGYVGNRDRGQLIRHIQEHHGYSDLDDLTTDELLLLHGMCHDRPQSAGSVKYRWVQQCGQNGCRWVKVRVK